AHRRPHKHEVGTRLRRLAHPTALFGAALPRHFLSFAPRFGQADRDRLFAALHSAAASALAALERAAFAAVHRAFHVLGSGAGIFACHVVPQGCPRTHEEKRTKLELCSAFAGDDEEDIQLANALRASLAESMASRMTRASAAI